jgi:nitroreductase
MLAELARKCRSYRRFEENNRISVDTLRELVDVGRIAASGANAQPLKYCLSVGPELNSRIFQHLSWAGHLKDWDGPVEGERPSAYITIVCDKQISPKCDVDHGISAQSIMLAAIEKGIGGCMISAMKRDKVHAELGLSDRYDVLLVLALGIPAETVVLETVGPDGNTKYHRDSSGVHHVPKRSLDEVILDV